MNQIIAFSLLLSFTSFALPSSEGSLLCEADRLTEVKGISCCTSRVTREKCAGLVEAHLDAAMLDTIASVKSDISAEKYGYQNAPNCHWTAMAYHDKDEAKQPRLLNFDVLEALVKENFGEVSKEKAIAGDIIIFYEITKTRVVGDDESGRPVPVWWQHTGPYHTGVYLGDGIAFQKEDKNSTRFTIDTIEHVASAYERILNGRPSLAQGRLVAKYFRRKN